MKIEYVHASKYGDGALVAEEFADQMEARGITVNVRHVKDADPSDLPEAELYIFSSPGRMGRPIRGMRRFLDRVSLPAGTRYALLTTEAEAQPDKKTGQVPTEEEIAKMQRIRPLMNTALTEKGLVSVGEEKVFVTGMKGPLEDGWEQKVADFAASLPLTT